MLRDHEPLFRLLDGPVTEHFDCGSPAQSNFYLNDAWNHQQQRLSKTFVMYYKGMKAGFVSMAPSEIQLGKKERPPELPFATLPALKVVQMGVNRPFQGLGLGRALVDYAIARALGTEEAFAYVILDSRPQIVGFYEKLGFVINEAATKKKRDDATQHGRDPAQATVSMRFDLREPGVHGLPKKRARGKWIVGVMATFGLIVGWRRKH